MHVRCIFENKASAVSDIIGVLAGNFHSLTLKASKEILAKSDKYAAQLSDFSRSFCRHHRCGLNTANSYLC